MFIIKIQLKSEFADDAHQEALMATLSALYLSIPIYASLKSSKLYYN